MSRWLCALVLAVSVAGGAAAQTPTPPVNPPGALPPGQPLPVQPTTTYERATGMATFVGLAGIVLVLLAICYPSRRY